MKKSTPAQTDYKKRMDAVLLCRKRGDVSTVSELTGYSESFIKKVVSGIRTSEPILQAFEELISGREQLKKFRRISHKIRKEKKVA